jgi:deoxyhypusine synthase
MKHLKKEDYLLKKIQPIDVKKVKNIDHLLSALRYTGFQGRNLGQALDILEKMVTNEECLTVLTLSGAMVPAGMGDLICVLMEYKLIDVLVTTGANITHDLVDAFSNIGHFLGSPKVNDDELFKHRINRIYDIFLPEENYNKTEAQLLGLLLRIFPEKNIDMAPSDFLKKLGENINQRCIVSVAAKNNIPVFVPAFSDSELALNLIRFTIKDNISINFRIFDDVKKYGEIIKKSKEHGTIIIGGGVPRNWAQQIFPFLENINKDLFQTSGMGFKYSVRIHTATEYDGGLSGCTISESKSWGKYSLDSRYASVWCDATIALPILVMSLLQRLNLI